jgi:hypothetical protein
MICSWPQASYVFCSIQFAVADKSPDYIHRTDLCGVYGTEQLGMEHAHIRHSSRSVAVYSIGCLALRTVLPLGKCLYKDLHLASVSEYLHEKPYYVVHSTDMGRYYIHFSLRGGLGARAYARLPTLHVILGIVQPGLHREPYMCR